VKKY